MQEYIYKAENVEKAINKGLQDLNLTENEVKIEVLEAGSTGLFGLFKKEAEVKLTPLDENYNKNSKQQILENVKEEVLETKIEKEEIKEEVQEVKEEVTKEEVEEEKNISEEQLSREEIKREDKIVANKEEIVSYIQKIVHSMGFDTAVVNFEEEGNRNYTLRITNVDNSSLLIGKRGNTLNSLQVLAENLAKRYTRNYYRINVDCDEYRENRKETLEELAINMAKKSKKLGKPIELEPMTSSERKIIHNALKDIKNVETESVGQDPHRYLIITAK
ncbi:RNA-binding cell elongation regulator Jag/EloR [Gemelliphila palaticanis]|uniref:RNA-binding protein KhpB n=1 Tax=Gemelliphila palaticanis TaxID=81950 RepID=A0ABX2T3M9_9BACL|nr:RNA-binding cell elongation regulator Jag/EloR [Gemella palaticanis]MBF0715915.1 Jag N-terminal domain-containing protein [Gemella palaticanis]NYS47845.1 Jag N-terminal domain-containing protein [Gemella palaticanis]